MTRLEDYTELVGELARALKENPPVLTSDGGFIAEGYDKELDEQNLLKDNNYQLVSSICQWVILHFSVEYSKKCKKSIVQKLEFQT